MKVLGGASVGSNFTGSFKWRVASWCSGYHYSTNSFIKAWTQVLRRLKYCSHVSEIRNGEDQWQWSRLEIRLRLLSVNHTTKAIHHHHYHHHHHHHHLWDSNPGTVLSLFLIFFAKIKAFVLIKFFL